MEEANLNGKEIDGQIFEAIPNIKKCKSIASDDGVSCMSIQ